MAKYREGRINEEVKRELAEIIRELKDPRIPVMLTVTHAGVTPDLKFAKVSISVLGDEKATEAAFAALKDAKGFIRRELSRRLKARTAPELTFVPDDSISYGAHIAKILKDIGEDK